MLLKHYKKKNKINNNKKINARDSNNLNNSL